MRQVRFLGTLLVGNWPSRIYLGAVAAAFVFWLATTLTWTQSDANMSGIWPLALTCPVSILILAVLDQTTGGSWTNPVVALTAMVIGALVNAFVIGFLAWLESRPRPR